MQNKQFKVPKTVIYAYMKLKSCCLNCGFFLRKKYVFFGHFCR